MILNSRPTVLMDLFSPHLNGKDVGDNKDPSGVYHFRDTVAVIKRDGIGFDDTASKPGTSEALPKIAYNVAYRPWDWILTTGLYVDDLDAAFARRCTRASGILVVLAGILSAVGVANRVCAHWAAKPSYAAQIANRIASNDLTAVVKTAPADRSSLLFSMKRMQEQLTHMIGTIKISADSIATASQRDRGGQRGPVAAHRGAGARWRRRPSTGAADRHRQAERRQRPPGQPARAVSAADVAGKGGEVVAQVVETMDAINAARRRSPTSSA